MSYRERYEQWLNDEIFYDAIHRELKTFTDKKVEYRFYCDLEFDTTAYVI